MNRPLCAAVLTTLTLWAYPGSADIARGVIEGDLRSRVEGLSVAEALPVIAYLEPLAADFSFSLPDETPLIRQAGARFDPRFLVVAVGQRVEIRNDDGIYHNVFSYSRPNDFDLGIYPEGVSKFLRFDTPGLVRLYCSIHDPMNGVIFVAPSPHFDLVDARGGFRIDSVPFGKYRLRTFSTRLPEQIREIHVTSAKTLQVDIEIAERRGAAERRGHP